MTETLQTPPNRFFANHNPYYRMATLYGEHESKEWRDADRDLHVKNQRAWNRWMAGSLNDAQRQALMEKGVSQQELTPFDDAETEALLADYRRRCASPHASLPSPRTIDFSNTRFDALFVMNGFICAQRATFENAVFTEDATFRGASFLKDVKFRGASFEKLAYFRRALFIESAFFSSAMFAKKAKFHEACFAKNAYFTRARVGEHADFINASFEGNAHFQFVEFTETAHFNEAVFKGEAHFQRVKFQEAAKFDKATFQTHPPEFFEARLQQDTLFHDVIWPPTPKDKQTARTHANAYERLKEFMDSLKRQEDEMFFFVKELQCKAPGMSRSQRWATRLFGMMSDYGQSITRPAVGLGLIALIGFVALLCAVGPGQAAVLSVAHTFGLIMGGAFQDDFKALPQMLRMIGGFQTLFGTIELFLIGLALRNRFRVN